MTAIQSNVLIISALKIFIVFKFVTTVRIEAKEPRLPTFNERLSLLLEPDKTFIDLVSTTGYNWEEHSVITEDGYILVIHRMHGGPKSPVKDGKPVVLVFSGIGANTDTWLLQGPRGDLAFMMVDEGYDVWFLNTRGTFYSKHHLHLSLNDEEYWKFNIHELGVFDAPAAIDYVLNATQKSKLSIIGHSLGTCMSNVLLSTKPEYNKKINVLISFAPIARMTQKLKRLWYFGVSIKPLIYAAAKTFGIYEIFPRSNGRILLYKLFCEWPRLEMFCQKTIYENLGIMIGKFDMLDPVGYSAFVRYYPVGIGFYVIIHCYQLLISHRFQQLDYGKEENYRRYNNSIPPEYPVQNIVAPVVLYSGLADKVSNIKDVKWLHEQLPNSTHVVINYRGFQHIDFIGCKVGKEVLFDDVLQKLKKWN